MILRSITISHFRSYSRAVYSFAPDVTVVIGKNAAGKTNLLEAIMLAATGKSFRAGTEEEMIRIGAGMSTVQCRIHDARDAQSLEVRLTRGEVSGVRTPRKRFLVNGIPRRIMDAAGILTAVLFWPENLEIITDSPGIRRRYLDSVLSQTDREYRRNLQSYERGLRQRNTLLSAIRDGAASRTQLPFWDQLLIRTGSYITDARMSYLLYANGTEISGHTFSATYDKSVISQARIDQYAREEVLAGTTLVGPHRDDFSVLSREHTGRYPDGLRDLAAYGSRGEQRLAVLWLKCAELSFIEKESGNRPVLLLDDIFSELDDLHRDIVGSVIRQQQTIITSADEGSVPKEIMRDALQIRI